MIRLNLLAMVRRARPALARLHRRVKLREITPTGVRTGDLQRIYGAVAAQWAGNVQRLLTAYTSILTHTAQPTGGVVHDDATTDIMSELLDAMGAENESLILKITVALGIWADKFGIWHRDKWVASLTPSNVNLTSILAPDDVSQTLDYFINQNVSLVRFISDSIRRRLEQIIYDALTNRRPAQNVARAIADGLDIERRRSLRIASDQTVKLSSQLDTARMLQAGITQWEWVHSGKLHFRPAHKARDGHVYTWDNAPADLPGMLPYCGCKKRAVLDL